MKQRLLNLLIAFDRLAYVLLFLPLEREHCHRAYLAERHGAQLPEEYRP